MRLVAVATLAALLVGSAGTAVLVPAYAQDAAGTAAPAAPGPGHAASGGGHGMWNHPGRQTGMAPAHDGGRSMRGNLLDIACGDRGAEALEIALIHVQYGVKPTAEQQPLFDALKTAALAGQKSFAATCQTARQSSATGRPNIVDRLQTRLTIDSAKVAALNDILPKFKVFYDSLTDQQKAALEQHGRRADGARGGNRWQHRGMMGPMHRQQPGTGAAPAPSAAETPSST